MTDAEGVVRELVARVATERGLAAPAQVRQTNSGGGNYTSALFTASIGDLKLFAKVAILGEKMRAAMNAGRLFEVEQIVYNEIVNTYNTLMLKHVSARPFRFPEVYASLGDVGKESLVMEDLTAQGYRAPLRQDSIGWRFAAAAVSKLADFHALSFAYEKEKPEEFAAMAESLKYEHPKYTPEGEKFVAATMQKMIGGAVQVVKDEHKERLLKVLSAREGFMKYREPISRTVLVHGDYRASNLMFKEQEGSLDIIVVDYQTVHSGCPVTDLLYFMFLGTDQQFRRTHYRDLLDHYHEELGAALNVLGMDLEQEYSKDVFEKDIIEMSPLALQYAMVVLPLVMVEESEAPQVAGDAELDQFVLAPSQLFAQRFQALVQDCADWGVI